MFLCLTFWRTTNFSPVFHFWEKRNAVNNYVGKQCKPWLSHANWNVQSSFICIDIGVGHGREKYWFSNWCFPLSVKFMCAHGHSEWRPYFQGCLAAKCSHVNYILAKGICDGRCTFWGEPAQGGTCFLLPFLLFQAVVEMWWLLVLRAEITWERKMHKAEQEGGRRLGPWYQLQSLTPVLGHLPLDFYWRNKEILVLFVLRFSTPNFYKYF